MSNCDIAERSRKHEACDCAIAHLGKIVCGFLRSGGMADEKDTTVAAFFEEANSRMKVVDAITKILQRCTEGAIALAAPPADCVTCDDIVSARVECGHADAAVLSRARKRFPQRAAAGESTGEAVNEQDGGALTSFRIRNRAVQRHAIGR